MPHLILSRREEESILMDTSDGPIEVTVLRIGCEVRLGVRAPASVTVHRREVADRIARDEERRRA